MARATIRDQFLKEILGDDTFIRVQLLIRNSQKEKIVKLSKDLGLSQSIIIDAIVRKQAQNAS